MFPRESSYKCDSMINLVCLLYLLTCLLLMVAGSGLLLLAARSFNDIAFLVMLYLFIAGLNGGTLHLNDYNNNAFLMGYQRTLWD